MTDLLIKGELVLYGTVGVQLLPDVAFFTDVDVAKALAEVGNRDLRVRLNSGGGLCGHALAIFNLLKSHRGRVHVAVDGVAASAGSLIAMAGATITMKAGAIMMVHEAQTLSIGTASDHAKTIESLHVINNSMVDIYAARTGRPREEIAAEMAAETWLGGAEAVSKGYADRVVEGEQAVRPAAFDYRQYAHAPGKMVAFAEILAGDGDWTQATVLPPQQPVLEVQQAAALVNADIVATCAMMGQARRAAAFIESGTSLETVKATLQAERVAAAGGEIIPRSSSHHPVATVHLSARNPQPSGGASTQEIAASWDTVIARVNASFGFKAAAAEPGR